MANDHSITPPNDAVIGRPDTVVGVPFVLASIERLHTFADRYGATLLRYSLGVIYIWFGALKLVGLSPAFALVGATLPWFDPHITVPSLGLVEVVLGLALLIGRMRRFVLIAILGHLLGTFLTFVTAPTWIFNGFDPLRLTLEGEFVLKNLILVSAAMVLLGMSDRS